MEQMCDHLQRKNVRYMFLYELQMESSICWKVDANAA